MHQRGTSRQEPVRRHWAAHSSQERQAPALIVTRRGGGGCLQQGLMASCDIGKTCIIRYTYKDMQDELV